MSSIGSAWSRARSPLGRVSNRALAKAGLRLERTGPAPVDQFAAELGAQQDEANRIARRHDAQTIDDVARLTQRYAEPVFGEVPTWDLIMMLAQCVDPTDVSLGNSSQLTHIEQILDAMAADGVTDEDLFLTAIVHDLGKLLLLTDEDPANVVCMNRFVETRGSAAIEDRPAPGCGVRELTPQWNHDEFVVMRLGHLLPDDIAWLLRYHSFMPPDIEPFLDATERERYERLHRPFYRYDQGSKSPHLRPRTQIADFRELVARRLPPVIAF